jgi:hypothetical protein
LKLTVCRCFVALRLIVSYDNGLINYPFIALFAHVVVSL